MPNSALNCIKHAIKWAWQQKAGNSGTARTACANKEAANDVARQISHILVHISHIHRLYRISRISFILHRT